MLSRASVKKPYLVVVMLIIVILLGVVSFQSTTVDLLPNIDMPMVVVGTVYAGASPDAVEMEVTTPIEEQMRTLDNIKNVSSMSQEHMSIIMLEFEEDTNIDLAVVDIREKLNLVKMMLPSSDMLMEPMIIKANPSMMPMMVTALSMEGQTVDEANVEYQKILDRIQAVEGVASVTTTGLVEEMLYMNISEDKLANSIMESLSDLTGSLPPGSSDMISNMIGAMTTEFLTPEILELLLLAQNLDVPAGNVTVNGVSFLVRVGDDIETLEELKNTPIISISLANLLNDFRIYFNIEQGEEFNLNTQDTTAYLKLAIDKLLHEVTALIDIPLPPIDTDAISVGIMSQLSGYLNLLATFGQVEATASGYIIPADLADDIFSMVEGSAGIKLTFDSICDIVELNNSGSQNTYLNGEPSTMLTIMKQPGYSTAEISTTITEILEDNAADNANFSYSILMDQGLAINQMVSSLMLNLILGGLLAVMIIFIFMRKIKPTIVIGASIVVSVVATFVMMYFAGITLNMISMGGLAIGVGMLVDNSIVVIENIYRMKSEGASSKRAAIYGAKQVSGAIFASTITTVVVFVPILFIEGIVKTIFLEMALTIAFSLFASLLVAITFVPAAASTWLKDEKTLELKWFNKFRNGYGKILEKVLNKKWMTAVVMLMLTVTTVICSVYMDKELMPSSDTGSLSVKGEVNLEKITSDRVYGDVIDDTIDYLNTELKKLDYIGSFGVQLSGDMMGDMMGIGSSNPTVSASIILDRDSNIKSKDAVKEIEELLAKSNVGQSEEVEFTVTGGEMMDISMLTGADIGIQITGINIDDMREVALEMAEKLSQIEGVTSVNNGLGDPNLEYKLVIDKDKASIYGLTQGQIMMELSSKLTAPGISGSIHFKENANTTDIYIYPTDFVLKAWREGILDGKEVDIFFMNDDNYIINTGGDIEVKVSSKETITVKNGEKIPVKDTDNGYTYKLVEGNTTTDINIDVEDKGKLFQSTEPKYPIDLVTMLIPVTGLADMVPSGGGIPMPFGLASSQSAIAEVSTYAALIKYVSDNSATLVAGDIVKVAVDETRGGQTSYYKWDGGQFIYDGNNLIGSPKTIPLYKLLSEESFVSDENGIVYRTDSEGELIYDEFGYKIPSEIAKINGYTAIQHTNGSRIISVAASYGVDSNSSDIMKQVNAIIAEYSNIPGMNIELAGESEMIMDTFKTFALILGLGILLIYLVMVAQFQSFKSPIIIMGTIPLAMIGSILLLAITGMSISAVSMIGIVVLAGVVVNNGIVFVDYANQLIEEGYTVRDAMLKTGRDRLRPILMTALTTICALLAMALDNSEAGAMMRPMAVSTIGGMILATALTLFLIPVLFEIFNKKMYNNRDGYHVDKYVELYSERQREIDASGYIFTDEKVADIN